MNFTIASLLVACAASEGFLKTIQLHQNAPPEPSALKESSTASATGGVAHRVVTADNKSLKFDFYVIPLEPGKEKLSCPMRKLDEPEKTRFENNNKKLHESELKTTTDISSFLKQLRKNFDTSCRRVFNFVISKEQDKMYAIQTQPDEKEIGDLTKHLSLTGAAPEVFMAGTFRLVKNEKEEHILVLDNDSGSYTPPDSGLGYTKKLLQANFKGLKIETLEVFEPQPEETKQWVGPLEFPLEGLGRKKREELEEKLKQHKVEKPAGAGRWEWQYSSPLKTCE